MPSTRLLTDARELWTQLAAVSVSFPDQGISVVASPLSRLCPPGWVGIVLLADSGIATAPDQATADLVRTVLAEHRLERLREPSDVAKILPTTATLGPAALAYVAPDSFLPCPGPAVEQLPVDHPDLRALEALLSPEERGEVSIDELTSPVFAIREDDEVIAASGYVTWPRNTAHIAVLTAPRARGRGLAKVAASSAVAHALAARMLPQWRARVPASEQVARTLGFAQLGVQVSVRLA